MSDINVLPLTRWPADGSEAVGRLSENVAFAVRAGDTLVLNGDRDRAAEFVRLLAEELTRLPLTRLQAGLPHAPSPTRNDGSHPFSSAVAASASPPGGEAKGGSDLAAADGVTLIDGTAPDGLALPADRLDLAFAADGGITATGHGRWVAQLARLAEIDAFRERAGVGHARLTFMQGDASTRRYAVLHEPAGHASPSWPMRDATGAALPLVLMDSPRQPDGPPVRDGLPYSRIAHLAEDVRPFVAIANVLGEAGFSVPRILAHDLERGLLLIEHLGDDVFGKLVAEADSAGDPARRAPQQHDLWRAGVDCLAALARVPVPAELPLPDGTTYSVPPYDARALGIETELIIDWYWPAIHGAPVPPDARTEFLALWRGVIDRLTALPAGWALRDYHSPNLLWLPQREGVRNVGIIDFQDAQAGPLAYDLVSLLQDARLDVAPQLESELLDHYCHARRAAEPGFDEPALRFAYAALGAQRNTKIVGIFARLSRRDGKHGYLAHIPRIWRYLARDLAHPELAPLRAWYDRHLPVDIRARVLSA